MKTCGSSKTKSRVPRAAVCRESSQHQVGKNVMTRHLTIKKGQESRVEERFLEDSRIQ